MAQDEGTRKTDRRRFRLIYRTLFPTLAKPFDAEDAHRFVFGGLRTLFSLPFGGRALDHIGRRGPAPRRRRVMGIDFPSAFGLAAGFDKGAVGVLPLLALGFSHIEIGTVTGVAQPGNPRPRMVRLMSDSALVNRMGFNNDGAQAVAIRLAKLRMSGRGRGAVIGVNIGRTKAVPAEQAISDYTRSARLLAPFANYLVVNVSSPNTPGLRSLQATSELRPLLTAVRAAAQESAARHVPLLVKIAPDLDDADVLAIADLALEVGLDGIIATNTTILRPATLVTDAETVSAAGAGGLSGPVLAPRAIAVLRLLAGKTAGRLALVSVGGVSTPDDVIERLEAGADLVQAYTGFVYGGPLWPGRIRAALAAAGE